MRGSSATLAVKAVARPVITIAPISAVPSEQPSFCAVYCSPPASPRSLLRRRLTMLPSWTTSRPIPTPSRAIATANARSSSSRLDVASSHRMAHDEDAEAEPHDLRGASTRAIGGAASGGHEHRRPRSAAAAGPSRSALSPARPAGRAGSRRTGPAARGSARAGTTGPPAAAVSRQRRPDRAGRARSPRGGAPRREEGQDDDAGGDDERRRREPEHRHRRVPRAQPAPARALEHAEHDQGDPQDRQDRADDVEAGPRPGDEARRRDPPQADQDEQHQDDLAGEDVAPAQVGRHPAAEQGPDRDAGSGEGPDHAVGERALAALRRSCHRPGPRARAAPARRRGPR